MYKFAAQNRLRFESTRGLLTVEQLFDLPLKADSGFDLDSVAKTINAALKSVSQESFVEETATSPEKRRPEMAFEVVKHVIKTKQDESKARENRMQRAAQRRKILDAMAAQQDHALTAASMEDLEKQLPAIDA